MSKSFLKATLLQFTGTVGAGIFSLPYALYFSNFYISALFMVVFAFLVILVNQHYLQIILSTKGDHQLPGYAQIYLGKRFRNLAILNIFILALGALSAYIKLAASFLSALVPISSFDASMIFMLALVLFFLVNNNFFNFLKFILPFIVLFISLVFYSLTFTLHLPTPQASPFSFIFIGPVLFSLASFTIVPEVEEVLRSQKNPKLIRLASMSGTILALFLYLVFSSAIIILSGSHLSTDSISGLSSASPLLASILSFAGFLIVFIASLNFTSVLKEVFYRDLSLNQDLSRFLALLVPFFCLFFSKNSFFDLISITGSITVFISVLIISLIRLKLPATPKDRILIYFLLSVFFFGLLSIFIF